MRFTQRIGNGVRNFLPSLWALKVHGETSLMTERVSKELTVFAVALTGFFLVESWAWAKAWGYGLEGSVVWPTMLGVIFGLAAALFDRSLMVADTRGKSNAAMFTVRAVLLVAIAFVTAIPVELEVFRPEIEQRIEQRALVAQNMMRNRALQAVDKKYDDLIAETGSLKATGGSAAADKLQSDIDDYTSKRAAARQEIVDRLTAKEAQIAQEAAGKGPSGRYGAGPAVTVMREQATEIKGELVAFDSETNAELTKLRGQRDQKIEGTATSLEQKTEQLRTAQEEERARVRKMSPAELAKEYLVERNGDKVYTYNNDWNPARGFLARFRELRLIETDAHDAMVERLKERDEEERWYHITAETFTVWMWRFAMLALGLFLLMLKILSSEETKTYFHFGSQAADGHSPRVVRMAEIMGHESEEARKTLGWTPKVKGLYEKLFEARRTLVEQMSQFHNRLVVQCRPGDSGLHLQKVAIHNNLREFWNSFVQPAVIAVDQAEEKARHEGLAIPSWPHELGEGYDPRSVKEPWRVTNQELIAFGWEDPSPLIEAGKAARVRVEELRREIEDVLLSIEGDMIRAIVHDQGLPEMDLRRRLEPDRHSIYTAEVVPRMRELRDLIKAASSVGLTVPPWDRRNDEIAMCWRLPDVTTLREYGWAGTGSVRTTPTPPPPAP